MLGRIVAVYSADDISLQGEIYKTLLIAFDVQDIECFDMSPTIWIPLCQ